MEDYKNEKSETITARINKRTIKKIRVYAKAENTTINSTINQLLSHAVDWDIVAAKTGWIPIPKEILVAFLEKLDDSIIIEVAEECAKHIPKDLLLAMRGKVNAKEWISILRSRAKAAGFHFNEIEEEDYIKFVMKHDMGMKWSTYFLTYYNESFRVLGCDIDCDITNNTISYKINKKDYELKKPKF